jgi:hypothetical protein
VPWCGAIWSVDKDQAIACRDHGRWSRLPPRSGASWILFEAFALAALLLAAAGIFGAGRERGGADP